MEGNELILKAPEGLTFRVQETDRRTVVIELVYDYQKPVIPKGFEYVKGEWDNGFAIKSKIDGSEFVWIPVGSLEADGSLDGGAHFDEKFGRRPINGPFFSDYEDDIPDDLLDSINKYGGVWISAHTASKEGENFTFKRGVIPFCEATRKLAKEAAVNYAKKYEGVKSCLPGEAGYDTLFKWLIQTGVKPKEEFTVNSKSWGNYTDEVLPTGSSEKYCVNNIYDLAGNCLEVSGGLCQGYLSIDRSGFGSNWTGPHFPATSHGFHDENRRETEHTSFRVLLYME